MKKIFLSLCSLMVIFSAGCGKVSTPIQETPTVISQNKTPIETPTFTSPSNNTPTASFRYTQTPSIRPTFTEIVQTVTSTQLPSIPPEAHLTIQCLDIAPAFPPEFSSDGSLILESEQQRDTYFLDLTTEKLTQVNPPGKRIIDIDVSPSGEWIAYRETLLDDTGKSFKENNLVLADANNNINRIIPWDQNWGLLITAWLDDQHIVIEYNPNKTATPLPSSEIPPSLIIVNPFTGEKQILSPSYPDIYQFPPIPFWKGWGETVYDPKLTRVVYLGGNNSPAPFNYVLWDISDHKSLASFQIVGDQEAFPRWYTDGERFAFAPGLITDNPEDKWPAYEVISVGRDGNATQLSHLTAYYPWTYISDLSWSPDGKKVAFWFAGWFIPVGPFTNGELNLAVVDTSSSKTTNYCVPGDFNAQISGLRRVPQPLWSPDGKQVVVENRFADTEKNSSRVILVDLEKNLAGVIANDMTPMGWVTAP